MICPSCGRELDPDVNFCYYCGHSFRQNVVIENPSETAVNYDVLEAAKLQQETETPMKTWQWVVYLIMMFIPYLWIVWLIVTVVWAFSTNGTKERKNIAKALLLTLLIVIVVVVIMLSVMINMYGADGTISRLTNGQITSLDGYVNSK